MPLISTSSHVGFYLCKLQRHRRYFKPYRGVPSIPSPGAEGTAQQSPDEQGDSGTETVQSILRHSRIQKTLDL